MAPSVSRLRRWFALGAILMVATVAGMYFYAQWSLRQAVHAIPAKIGLNIQQTAEGFSISKSVQGRTQFTVSASKAVQFKEGGRAELHNVKIVIYGKDSSRFDQIAGDDFEYDPVSGEVTTKGRVLIDLQANPEGIRQSDQSAPAPPKAPIHLESNGLVFNKNTGDASASGKVVFQTPQASGSAVGIQYFANSGTMNLLSAVEMTVNRPRPVHLDAARGVITKQPHQVVLTTAHMVREQQEMRSNQATFFLREDNTVDRVLAEGDVESGIHGKSETHSRSDQAELWLTGSRNLLTIAILTGNVQLTSLGTQPADAAAGRVTLHFAGSAQGSSCWRRFMPRTASGSHKRTARARLWLRELRQGHLPELLRQSLRAGEGKRAISRRRDDRPGDGLYREKRPSAGTRRDQRAAADRYHAARGESEDGGYSRQVHGNIHGEKSPGHAAWRARREDRQQPDRSN